MKKKMLITCTVVLVTAAVILGFVLKNQVRENPDKNTVNVAIGQWGTTQNESQNYWNPDNHAVAKGMGGYYFIQTTDGISKIAFFDETTQEAVAVCAKPECTHSDNTCNVYLCDMKQTGSTLYLTDTIYCYNGYLYLIQCEGGMGKLVRIHTDGSARETIADLFANTGVSSISLVFHENDVYAYDDTGHAGQEEEAEEVIKKISLTDGTEQTVFSYTGTGASIDRGRSFGDKLYFVIREYTKNKETKAVSSDYKGLFEYDFATGDTRKVIDADVCDYHADTENQTLFYFVQGTGLYAYDMTQGSNTLIYPAEDELIQCKMSYDGKNLYLFNNGARQSHRNKSTHPKILLCAGYQRNQIAKIICNGVVYFGDTDYLFEENADNLEYMKKENLSDKSEWIQVN